MARLEFSAKFLSRIIRCCVSEPALIEMFYKHCDLTDALLHDERGIVSLESYRKFWELAQKEYNTPCPGFLLSEKSDISMVGIIGYLLQTCPDIKTTMEHLVQNLDLLTTVTDMKAYTSGNKYIVEIIPAPEFVINHPIEQRCEAEYIAYSMYFFARKLLRRDVQLFKMEMNFPEPAFSYIYEKKFRTNISYNHHVCRMFFYLDDVCAPLMTFDPALYQSFLNMVDAELQKVQREKSFTRDVQNVILKKIRENAIITVDSVAGALNLSVRNLQRMLTTENTTFIDLYNHTRKHMAIRLLETSKLTIKEISFLFGYNDISAFRKAFKRWTGQSPSYYRNDARVSVSMDTEKDKTE
ncbi:MAG: helix-turn-helix domain-containing protein [Bacteroidetes bacterium]|nr:helix-turn-helix domain-containing protein [Bacteroidota bacterium]